MEDQHSNVFGNLEDNMLVNFLLSLKTLINRGYFTTYYRKLELKRMLENINQAGEDNILVRQFSFIRINERNEGKNIYNSGDIFNVIKNSSFDSVSKMCLELYFIQMRFNIKNYNCELDNSTLITMATNVVDCIKTFKRCKVIEMDYIEDITNKFVIFIIGNIASLDSKSFNDKPILYHFLVKLILVFKEIPKTHSTIFTEITKMIISLNKYMDDIKKSKLDIYKSEAFGILLNILMEVLELRASSKKIIATEILSITFNNEEEILLENLNCIKKFVPDYLQFAIECCIELIKL